MGENCYAESVALVWDAILAAQQRSGSAPRRLRIDLKDPADLGERRLVHDFLQTMVLPYTAEIITPWVHMRNPGRQLNNPRPVRLCDGSPSRTGACVSPP